MAILVTLSVDVGGVYTGFVLLARVSLYPLALVIDRHHFHSSLIRLFFSFSQALVPDVKRSQNPLARIDRPPVVIAAAVVACSGFTVSDGDHLSEANIIDHMTAYCGQYQEGSEDLVEAAGVEPDYP